MGFTPDLTKVINNSIIDIMVVSVFLVTQVLSFPAPPQGR